MERLNFLDFKEKHHTNMARLVHDILCLANSNANSDRYLIFGINNKKEIVGIGASQSRKKQADIMDTLRKIRFNMMPSLQLYELKLGDKEVDVLHIENTRYKPYILLEKYECNEISVRAGSIYTRDNDSNTPIDSTGTSSQMEAMWRERFGLDKSPLERSFMYIKDIPAKWRRGSQEIEEYHYNLFPEFRLVVSSEPKRNDFNVFWKDPKRPCSLGNTKIAMLYHQTTLEEFYVIQVHDKGTYIPQPKYYEPNGHGKCRRAYILKSDIENYVCAILMGVQSLDSCDKEALQEMQAERPIDVYFYSANWEMGVAGLKVKFEDQII